MTAQHLIQAAIFTLIPFEISYVKIRATGETSPVALGRYNIF